MKIERRYTKSGQDAYQGLDFRKAVSEIKNPDGSIVFRLDGYRGSRLVEPGRLRHPGAEIFPQSGRAGGLEARRGRDRSLLAVALGRR